jgi:hypothetical protein
MELLARRPGEDPAGGVDHAALGLVGHDAAAERVHGHQRPAELPPRRLDVRGAEAVDGGGRQQLLRPAHARPLARARPRDRQPAAVEGE